MAAETASLALAIQCNGSYVGLKRPLAGGSAVRQAVDWNQLGSEAQSTVSMFTPYASDPFLCRFTSALSKGLYVIKGLRTASWRSGCNMFWRRN